MTARNHIITVSILLLLILTACVSGERQRIETMPGATVVADTEASPSIRHFREYRLGNGDVLDIIYQVRPLKIEAYRFNIQDVVEVRFPSMPDENHAQVVRSDGKITLPYIGDISVLNLTPTDATQRIREAYEGTLRFPDVYLLVKEFGAGTKELKRVITTASRGQSKLLTVRPDGFVTFPLIGEYFVAGKTIPEISAAVNRDYKQLYPELQVDVILFKTEANYIYVLGEVKRAGAFAVQRPITVYEALALAGGVTDLARQEELILGHRKGNTITCQRLDLTQPLTEAIPIQTEAMMLWPDDLVYVPKRRLATIAQIAREISDITFFNGYSIGFSWELHSADDE